MTYDPQDKIKDTATHNEAIWCFLQTHGCVLPDDPAQRITLDNLLAEIAEQYLPENIFSQDECDAWARSNGYVPDPPETGRQYC